MDKAVKNLLKIKSLVTLSLTATFVYLSLRGHITEQEFMSVFLMVISFYFGTQTVEEYHEKEEEEK